MTIHIERLRFVSAMLNETGSTAEVIWGWNEDNEYLWTMEWKIRG
jgi:hypothetical protein